MDAIFTGLTKSQCMLLLTTIVFGGKNCLEFLDFLPQEEAELLRHRAQKILATPRTQRVPFLVQEIKRLKMKNSRTDVVQGTSPKQIAEALFKERPALVEILLRALPQPFAEQVRHQLAHPETKLRREIRPEVLAVIRWKFEQQLEKIVPQRSQYTAQDLLTMHSRDLNFVADALGAQSLATLLALLPPEKHQPVWAQLSPEQKVAVRQYLDNHILSSSNQLSEEFLCKENISLEVRLLGIRKIARACLAQSAEFAARVIEEHRDSFGRQLAESVSSERKNKSGISRLHLQEVLSWMNALAQEGRITKPAVKSVVPSIDRTGAKEKHRTEHLKPRLPSPPSPLPPRVQFGGAAAMSSSGSRLVVKMARPRLSPRHTHKH